MEKELQDLLDNYEKVIYGQAFPISPTTHQIHLLLDYIANQSVQLKKQKEIIDKVRKVFEECKMLLPHEFDWEEQVDNVLNILKEV